MFGDMCEMLGQQSYEEDEETSGGEKSG